MAVSYWSVFVQMDDGTGKTVMHEPDTNRGRRNVDDAAFALLARPEVTRVIVERVDRFASMNVGGHFVDGRIAF